MSKFLEDTMDLPPCFFFFFPFFRGKAKSRLLGSWESKDESHGREKAASKRDRIFSGLLGNHSELRSFLVRRHSQEGY